MSTYCNYWNKVNLVKSKIKQSKKIDSIGIGLASPEEIRRWGERRLPNGTLIGKVDKDHTVDYESLKPIEGGLFCERIFGPVEDFYCSCDRKGEKNEKFCPNCEVEFTKSRVRRVRMGYIPLAVPVVHVWYLRGRPSYIANLVGKNRNSIDRLAYGETLCESFIGFSSLKSFDKKEGFNNFSLDNIEDVTLASQEKQKLTQSPSTKMGVRNKGVYPYQKPINLLGAFTPTNCFANIEDVKEAEELSTQSIEFAKGFITNNESLCLSSCAKQSVGVNDHDHIVKPDDKLLQNIASRVKQTGSISLMLSQKFPTPPALSVTSQPTSNSLRYSYSIDCVNKSFTNIFDVKQSLMRKAKKGYSYASPTGVSTASFNELVSYSLPRYLCAKLRRGFTWYEVLHSFRRKASKEEVRTFTPVRQRPYVSKAFASSAKMNSVMARVSIFLKLRSSFILLPVASETKLTSFTSCSGKAQEMLVRSNKQMLVRSKKGELAPNQKTRIYLSASFDREPSSKTSPLQAPSKFLLGAKQEGLGVARGLQRISNNKPIASNDGFFLASLTAFTSCSGKAQEMLVRSNKQMLMGSKKELLGRSKKGESAPYQNQIFEQKQKYLKYHTLPLFSTFVYKEWSHRFSFLEYFIWSARNNDLVLPFYTYQNSRSEERRANLGESIRKNSLNLIKNKFFLRFSNKSHLSLNATVHMPFLRSKENIDDVISAKMVVQNKKKPFNLLGGAQALLTPFPSCSGKAQEMLAKQMLTKGSLSKDVTRTKFSFANEGSKADKERLLLQYSKGLFRTRSLELINKERLLLQHFLGVRNDKLKGLQGKEVGELNISDPFCFASPFLAFQLLTPKKYKPALLTLRPKGVCLSFVNIEDVSKPSQSDHFVPSGNFFDLSTANQPFYQLRKPLQVDHSWSGLRKASTLPLLTNRFSLRSKGTPNGASEVRRKTYLNYYNPLTNPKVSTVSPFWAFTGPIPNPFTDSLVSRKQLKGFAYINKVDEKQSTKMDTQQFPRLTELLNFTGGAALRSLLSRFDLVVLSKFLRHELKNLELKVNHLLALKMLTYSQGLLLGKLAKRRSKQIRRLKLLELFQSQKSNPEWMILSVIPVLPPDLRPILRVNDDFVVASDLNRLYQTVLRRNNTIHERLDDPLPCPESGLFRQRSLQKAVDGLLENGKGGGTPLCASKRRPLVSLSHVLKGKKGLFRQHLLGKRVDYSGRSVIVVGPRLQLHECGLPKEMAIELFQPFLLHRLKVKGMATSNTAARRMIQQGDPVIWHILKQLVYEHPVLLNRAPTLHRLGIQAFQPRLVSGRAILLHPLVCNGFNADFDGDQMAVHVPLSFQARAEAWKIMWSKNNFLSPATGQPILVPSQDMVLGCYYLSVSIPRILNANVIPPASNLKDLSLCSARGTQKKEGFILVKEANVSAKQEGGADPLLKGSLSKGVIGCTQRVKKQEVNRFIEPAYGVDRFIFTPSEVKESVINITCNRPSQRQSTFLNENKGRYFSNLQDSLLAYFQGRLQTHTPFWVRIDPVSFHPPLLTKNVQLRTKFSFTKSKFTCGPKPQLCKTLYSRFAYRAKLEEAFTITSTSASVLQPLYGSSREMCKTLFQNKSANYFQTRVEANETLESPLELRLSVDGNLANILTMFQNHYNYNATWVKQCKEESIQYMRTTAGRVVINEAVFKDF